MKQKDVFGFYLFHRRKAQYGSFLGGAQDLKALPTGDVERLRTRHDTILTEAEAEAGNPPHPCRPGTRGRIKQSPAGNLIRRLREHRNEVLRSLAFLCSSAENYSVEMRTRPARRTKPSCTRTPKTQGPRLCRLQMYTREHAERWGHLRRLFLNTFAFIGVYLRLNFLPTALTRWRSSGKRGSVSDERSATPPA